MPKRSSASRLSDDFIEVTSSNVDLPANGTVEEQEAKHKNPAAVALGKLGGAKGGKARAASLSAEKRAEIAQKAAIARWKRRDQSSGEIRSS